LILGTRIVLLSDGTGNSAAKVWRTNVWRVFESLELAGAEQVAFYDDGVGTSAFKPLAILGGAFGWGLKRNVLALYRFLCRNYRSDDDEIFAFGFSRGAFTIRILIGLVAQQGLVTSTSEEELNRKTKAAYRAYRAETFHSKIGIERIARWIWHWFVSASHDKTERPVRRIRFVGLWDTVAAYGLPVDEMTRGVSRYLWPLELPDHQLSPKVNRACHALSLDDERTTFHPVLWDESAEHPATPDEEGVRCTQRERISQIWFAGVHSNVGGGYPDDSLAYVPLNWMLAEAQACGLKFKRQPTSDPDAIIHAKSAEDKDGRLYDSRSGLGGYYRYGPRKLDELCHFNSRDPRDRVEIPITKIHESVIERIKSRSRLYAPIGLPEKYELVTNNGFIVPQDKYETPATAKIRGSSQESIWNIVWRRRAIYFLTVFTSLYLATYPLYQRTDATGEFTTALRLVSDAIRLAGTVLPNAALPWLNAYAIEPDWFLLVGLIVGALIYIGSKLGANITDRMNIIWGRSLGVGTGTGVGTGGPSYSVLKALAALIALYIIFYPILPKAVALETYPATVSLGRWIDYYRMSPIWEILTALLLILFLPAALIFNIRTSRAYVWTLRAIKLRFAPALFAFLFVYLGLAFGSHLLFTAEDAAGLACEESTSLDELRFCSSPTIAMCNQERESVCSNMHVKAQCQTGSPVCGAGNVAMCDNVPAVCPKPCTDDVKIIKVNGKDFDTKNVCFATGLKVERWGTYRLTVAQNEPIWSAFSGWIQTNAGGFRIANRSSVIERTALLFLWPLKRSFIRPWFAVVARVGATGNDEDFLDPDEDPGSAPKKVILEESKFRPRRDGELFLYVNDAVFAGASLKSYLRYFDFFYRGNEGTAEIKIERIPN
jgi:uncharacterized protein (DUF2235 family)